MVYNMLLVQTCLCPHAARWDQAILCSQHLVSHHKIFWRQLREMAAGDCISRIHVDLLEHHVVLC